MDNTLKNLPPKERVKAIRQLQEEKRRELEELEKKRKEELAEAEDEVQKSLEEAEEEERATEKRVQTLREQLKVLEEESLEEKVAEARSQHAENTEYHSQPKGKYTPLGTIVDDLNHLQHIDNWNQNDEALYVQRREELTQTQQYTNELSDALRKQLDEARGIIHNMQYR